MKLLVRSLCKEGRADPRNGFLCPLLRWGSIHVIHREANTADNIHIQFKRWALDIGFDCSALIPFDELFSALEAKLTEARVHTRIIGFEFATDGYNLMVGIRLSTLNGKDIVSGRVSNFLRKFAMSYSTVQTAALIGQTENEMMIGLLHARLPVRAASVRNVWILQETAESLSLSDEPQLKEVG